MIDVIGRLYEIYRDYETWHTTKLSKEEADKYHKKLLYDGNIIYIPSNNDIVGYVEFWRINFEQFGRIIAGERFYAMEEDILSGNLAYVNNVWINPNERFKKEIYKQLHLQFIHDNFKCTHFCGIARRKKCAPVKVFKRENVLKEDLWEEVKRQEPKQQHNKLHQLLMKQN